MIIDKFLFGVTFVTLIIVAILAIYSLMDDNTNNLEIEKSPQSHTGLNKSTENPISNASILDHPKKLHTTACRLDCAPKRTPK